MVIKNKFNPGDRVSFISKTSQNAKYFGKGLTNLEIKGIHKIDRGSGYDVWEDDTKQGSWFANETELKLASKFQIGDLIRYNGKKSPHYLHTNKDAVCKVIKVYNKKGEDINVEIVGHKESYNIGKRWDVNSKYFDPIKVSKSKEKLKVGDLVTGTVDSPIGDSSYTLTTNRALMEVIKIMGGYIEVKILFHKIKKYQKEVGSIHSVESKYFKKVQDVGKLIDLIKLKREEIISEIKKNSSMKKCFSNVNKEVNEWSIAQVLGWFDEGTEILSRLY